MKLIFLDIDGTLTPLGGKEIPASARKALDRTRALGNKVFLCSGRNHGMMAPLRASYPFDGEVGCGGGWVEIGGKEVYSHPMEPGLLEKTMDVLHKENICCVFETIDTAYMDEPVEKLMHLPMPEDSIGRKWAEWLLSVSRDFGWQPASSYHGEPVYKAVFIGFDEAALQRASEQLDLWFHTCVHSVAGSGVVNGEMIQRAFDKGRGILRVCEALQVPVGDTVAFGDSPNDIEMLQTAGLGICMGNGHPQAKAAAGMVCPPVDADGLAEGLRMAGLLDG